MRDQMRRLQEQLAGEIACYRELLKVAESERDILMSGGHQRLMQTSEQKLALAQRLTGLQGGRRELMLEMSPDKQSPLRLKDLTGFLPPEDQGPFRRALGEAQSLADRVSGLNQLNKGFVEEALDTVDHLLTIMSGGGGHQGYSPHGLRPAPSRPRILTREV